MKPFLTMLGTFVLSLLIVNGQTVDWEKVEKLSASSLEPCMSGRSVYPNWIKGTSCFYYDVKQGDTNTYYLFDARTGRKTPLVKDIEGFGQYPVSKGVISLQNDRGTSYQAYIAVQNEIVKAINEIREDFCRANYGKAYENLTEEQQEIAREAVPQLISEAEPKDVSQK